jgi:hypothetical protein
MEGRVGPRRWEGAGQRDGGARWHVPMSRHASRPGGWREGGAGLERERAELGHGEGPARRGCGRLLFHLSNFSFSLFLFEFKYGF